MSQFFNLEYIYPTRAYLERQITRTTSLAYKVRTFRRPGVRWRLELFLAPRRANDDDIVALDTHMQEHGFERSFSVIMPQKSTIAIPDTTLTQPITKGDESINILGPMIIGRRVKIGNFIYETLQTAQMGGEVRVTPKIQADAPMGAEVEASLPAIDVYYDDEYPLAIPINAIGNARPAIRLVQNV